MMPLIEIRRLTVIAEASLRDMLADAFLEMGAKGYSCIDCSGVGKDVMMEDPSTGKTHVQLTVLARRPLAEALLQHVHQLRKKGHKVIGSLEPILVYEDDAFF